MSKVDQFYHGKKFRSLVDYLKADRLNHDGFITCAHCGKRILAKYDCIAHHTVELTEENVDDATISLNPDLIELICFQCHNIEHARFGFESLRQVYLVYGSPCSGKTTWVRKNANPEDLILDIDSIWQMITVNERYVKPNRLRANVFGLWDELIRQVQYRVGKWRCAYIIGGYPLKMDRERLCNQLGAEEVFIDVSKDECITRAKQRGGEWSDYVEKWFEMHTE